MTVPFFNGRTRSKKGTPHLATPFTVIVVARLFSCVPGPCWTSCHTAIVRSASSNYGPKLDIPGPPSSREVQPKDGRG